MKVRYIKMETKNFDSLNDMILGPSGVGKTVFLSSLFQGTVNSCIKKDDCFVNLNSRSENGDNDMISSVVNAMGSARSYTTDTLMGKVKGTIAKINFNFDININDKSNCFVIPTHFIDYRGGATVSAKDKEQFEETAQLIETMENADIIRIFVEGPVLYTYRDNLEKAKVVTGANIYNQYFSVLNKVSRKENVSVVVTITKCDSDVIPADYRSNGFLELKKLAVQVFDVIFCYAHNLTEEHNWSFSLVPVSACQPGTTKSEFNEQYGTYFCTPKAGSKFIPQNICLSYLMGICMHMESRMKTIQRAIKFYTDDICNINLKSIFDRKANRARYDNDTEKIKEYTTKLEELKVVTATIRKLFADNLPDFTIYSA